MRKETQKNYDLRKILRPFENKWVALTPDNKKVIASGDTLNETASKVEKKDVIFMKVLTFRASYAPLIL
ncbi:MAG: DUF5678 domain-containing protein [Patescibacteria group bacterium]